MIRSRIPDRDGVQTVGPSESSKRTGRSKTSSSETSSAVGMNSVARVIRELGKGGGRRIKISRGMYKWVITAGSGAIDGHACEGRSRHICGDRGSADSRRRQCRRWVCHGARTRGGGRAIMVNTVGNS